MVDLLERVSQLKKQVRQMESLIAPLGWKLKYIIKDGETPWWRADDSKERALLQSRQYLRMKYKNNPSYNADAARRHRERH
ncbi:hypothetical protein LCGC14_3100040, partial [marine sediment metagenome]